VADTVLDRSLAMLRPSNRPMSCIKMLEPRPMSVKIDQMRLNSARNMKTRGRLEPLERAKTPSVVSSRVKLINKYVCSTNIQKKIPRQK
jgi:hypothetical protein